MQSNATHRRHRYMCQLSPLPSAKQYIAMQSKATQKTFQRTAKHCNAMQSKAMQDIAKQSNAKQCSTRLVLSVSVDRWKPPNWGRARLISYKSTSKFQDCWVSAWVPQTRYLSPGTWIAWYSRPAGCQPRYLNLCTSAQVPG